MKTHFGSASQMLPVREFMTSKNHKVLILFRLDSIQTEDEGDGICVGPGAVRAASACAAVDRFCRHRFSDVTFEIMCWLDWLSAWLILE